MKGIEEVQKALEDHHTTDKEFLMEMVSKYGDGSVAVDALEARPEPLPPKRLKALIANQASSKRSAIPYEREIDDYLCLVGTDENPLDFWKANAGKFKALYSVVRFCLECTRQKRGG